MGFAGKVSDVVLLEWRALSKQSIESFVNPSPHGIASASISMAGIAGTACTDGYNLHREHLIKMIY